MQNAKRYILVDERIYDDLWKRTPTDTSKDQLNRELHTDLHCSKVPDDLKAKQYQNTLNRFLNIKSQVPDLQPITPNGSMVEPRKKRKQKWTVWDTPVRQSKRKHRKEP